MLPMGEKDFPGNVQARSRSDAIGLPPGTDLRPIPSKLHSVYDGRTFTRCSVCRLSLDATTLYEIQKVFRGPRVVFEMALCQHCGERLCDSFSSSSIDSLKGYLLSHFHPHDRIDVCHFCEDPLVFAGHAYTLIGAAKGEGLLLPPIVLCQDCGCSLQERLSPETRAAQDAFVRAHFACLPDDFGSNPTFGGVFS